jgi:hypothetical protein
VLREALAIAETLAPVALTTIWGEHRKRWVRLNLSLLKSIFEVEIGSPAEFQWMQRFWDVRHLMIRLARPRLHDRLILLDRVTAWVWGRRTETLLSCECRLE